MADFPKKTYRFDFGAGKISYRKLNLGAGPITVWVHGFLENSNMWSPIFPALRPDGTHLMIDLPGHGKSDVFGPIHTMDFMADCIAQLLVEENISDPIRLIGHSMGGYVSLAFLDRYPERVSAINLYHSTAFADSEEKKENRNRAIKALEAGRTFFVKSSVQSLFAASLVSRLTEEIDLATTWALETKPKGISAALAGMRDRPNRKKVYEQCDRSYAIVGQMDPAIDPKRETSYLEQNPNIHKTLISEVGHMSHLENTKAAVEALQVFLTETS